MINNNPMMSLIMDTDSYKFSHFLQYPKGTDWMFSYAESRGGKYEKTVQFGVLYFLERFLTKQITAFDVEEAKSFADKHGVPFNYKGWMKIVTKFAATGRPSVRRLVRVPPFGLGLGKDNYVDVGFPVKVKTGYMDLYQ